MKKGNNLPPALLKKEIEMQTMALKRIRSWINICLIVSSVGILLVYLGLNSDPYNLYYLIPGILLAGIGIVLAIVFGYGHHNGKKNVEKMINVLETEVSSSKKE